MPELLTLVAEICALWVAVNNILFEGSVHYNLYSS
jgi:hypothetical protein